MRLSTGYRRLGKEVPKVTAVPALIIVLLAMSCLPLTSRATDRAGFADVETITVMPILLSEQLEIESPEEVHDNVAKMLLRKLAFKGYVLDKPRKWEQPKTWTAEWVRSLNPQDLAAAMPGHATHVALLFVEGLEESSVVVASKAEAQVSAMVLDTGSATVIWENGSSGDYRESIGLLVGLAHLLVTRDKYIALDNAFEKLFEPFPEKPFD